MTGVRETPNEPFRYMRLPLDAEGGIESHMQLRAILIDERMRGEIGRRFASNATTGASVSAATRARLAESAERVLQLFAVRGLDSVVEFIEKSIRNRISQGDGYSSTFHPGFNSA